MKNSIHSIIRTIGYCVFLLGFTFLLTACKDEPKKEDTAKPETEEVVKVNYVYWDVKAVLPDGKGYYDVKAFDSREQEYNIKAVQDADQDIFLDVKAFAEDGTKLPVKILMTKEQFAPVSVINNDGNEFSLKAITPEGEKLDVKGIRRFGNIVMIKAMKKDGKYLGLQAISPDGKKNDIKGIKVNRGEREMSLKGVGVHAHVKAMHPSANEAKFKMYKKSEINKKRKYKSDFERIIWNIKAVTADGKKMDVKAIDPEGNMFDVQAAQDSEQHSFMNIKAFVEGYELPVKVMQSEDEYRPVNAIGTDGVIYQVKAVSDDVQYDIKGVSREGRIINVKAVTETGEFLDVQVFGPKGKINYVNGIKIFDREVEMKVQGQPVYAHVKALNK